MFITNTYLFACVSRRCARDSASRPGMLHSDYKNEYMRKI